MTKQRILTLLAVFTLVFSMAACGRNNNNNTGTTNDTTTNADKGNDGALEDMGEGMDNMAEDVKDAVKEPIDDMTGNNNNNNGSGTSNDKSTGSTGNSSNK